MASLSFLILLLVILVLVTVTPQILRRFYIPSVVAVMLLGILIGPNGLDILRVLNRYLGRGFPTEQLYEFIEVIGLLGLVFLMSLAGLEINLSILKMEKKAVALLSVLTFLIPAAAGFAVYSYFRPGDLIGQILYASLFASHSVGLVFPIIKELDIMRTRFGVAVLASTVVTDIGSLVLLAVAVQMKRQEIAGDSQIQLFDSISLFDRIDIGLWFIPVFLVGIAIFIVGVLILVPKISMRLSRYVAAGDNRRLSLFLIIVLVVSIIGEVFGINIIVGAFVAGLAFARSRSFHAGNRILHQKIEALGYGFIIPFLFLDMGMQTDFRVLFAAAENLVVVAVTVIVLIASKVFAGWVALRLSGFSHQKSFLSGLMTVPQLSATLAAAAVGFQLQIIDAVFLNTIIVLAIITSVPVPTLVRLTILKGKMKFDPLPGQPSIEPVDDSLASAEEFYS